MCSKPPGIRCCCSVQAALAGQLCASGTRSTALASPCPQQHVLSALSGPSDHLAVLLDVLGVRNGCCQALAEEGESPTNGHAPACAVHLAIVSLANARGIQCPLLQELQSGFRVGCVAVVVCSSATHATNHSDNSLRNASFNHAQASARDVCLLGVQLPASNLHTEAQS